jgi:hypothetical protein
MRALVSGLIVVWLAAGCAHAGGAGPASKTVRLYEHHEIPGNIGVSSGRYTDVDGYRHVNIAVEFEQRAPDEEPVSLGVVFAHDAEGRFGARR